MKMERTNEWRNEWMKDTASTISWRVFPPCLGPAWTIESNWNKTGKKYVVKIMTEWNLSKIDKQIDENMTLKWLRIDPE